MVVIGTQSFYDCRSLVIFHTSVSWDSGLQLWRESITKKGYSIAKASIYVNTR